MLTPQESAALFDTLKRFVASGLSIIFISHKLNEVLAVCHRVSRAARRQACGRTRRRAVDPFGTGRTDGRPRHSAGQGSAYRGRAGAPRLDGIVARRRSLTLDGVSLDPARRRDLRHRRRLRQWPEPAGRFRRAALVGTNRAACCRPRRDVERRVAAHHDRLRRRRASRRTGTPKA